MFIKEITLEGFKTYGNRTDIKDFDPLFNAITGLNGSGKSSIVDAICFVLGINNLTQVRAGSLQDLVYKNGQAGITKASVSITFDNTDKDNTPIGYEGNDSIVVTRQVVVGGKNRYLVNGVSICNNRVADLFRSVQLNVNNPTFLVMQGRITKVLNMKPLEILGMIEEAAGTKMYEQKKLGALNTIEKKNAKLSEIDKVLTETMSPTIEKLKQERSAYLEFQGVQRNLTHTRRLHVIHQYAQFKAISTTSAHETSRMQSEYDDANAQLADCDQKMEELDRMIADIETRKAREPASKVNALLDSVRKKETAETVVKSELKALRDAIKDDEKRLTGFQKRLATEEKTLASREKAQENKARNWEAVKAECDRDTAAFEQAQVRLEQASRGNMAGDENSLRSQLDDAKAKLIQSKSKCDKAAMGIKPLKEALKKKEDEAKKTKGDYEKSAGAKQKLIKDVEALRKKKAGMNYDESVGDELETQRNQLAREVGHLRDQVNAFDDRHPRFAFTYTDPERNFDRKRVIGVVAKLFDVVDSKFMQAIEIAAGARLFNIIVDTNETGKLLLSKGQLQRRVTCIPLNKISGFVVDQATVDKARKVARSSGVWRALDLVSYDPELAPAMNWLFGSQLVCETMEIARCVADDKSIQRRCVTLDGDVFDPSGTLSGGARERGPDLLEATKQLRKHMKELSAKEKQVLDIEKRIGSPEVIREYKKVKEMFEMKTMELQAMEQQLACTSHHKIMEELRELTENLREQEQTTKSCRDEQQQLADVVKDLEYKLKNLDKLRENAVKDAKKELQECEKRAKASAAKMAGFEKEAQEFAIDMEAATKEIADIRKNIDEMQAKIAEAQGRVPQLEEALQKAKEETEATKEELNKQREVIAAADKQIQNAQTEKKAANKLKNDMKLKIQKLEHDLKAVTDRTSAAEAHVARLMEDNDWLPAEVDKLARGASSMEVDLSKVKEIEKNLAKLEEKEKKLSRTVNTKAMNMLGLMEEKYVSLMKKKDQVESDKKKIQKFIDELDQKKNEVLVKAHEKVSQHFGSIFSGLLHRARAKLEPPAGKTVLDGLEVKVAFGEVWKESLAELSGGQRSLVALSLILAILLFKPAPLYILDEVDAALDLSHTQNIGSLLKDHFQRSQFIVVSLKEGMFSKANVLFQTKFENGMSTVVRKQGSSK